MVDVHINTIDDLLYYLGLDPTATMAWLFGAIEDSEAHPEAMPIWTRLGAASKAALIALAPGYGEYADTHGSILMHVDYQILRGVLLAEYPDEIVLTPQQIAAVEAIPQQYRILEDDICRAMTGEEILPLADRKAAASAAVLAAAEESFKASHPLFEWLLEITGTNPGSAHAAFQTDLQNVAAATTAKLAAIAAAESIAELEVTDLTRQVQSQTSEL